MIQESCKCCDADVCLEDGLCYECARAVAAADLNETLKQVFTVDRNEMKEMKLCKKQS